MCISPSARAAIIGSGGYLGSALAAGLRRRDRETLLAARSGAPTVIDLADPKPDLSAFERARITHAVIAASVTGFAACEREPERTREVNVAGTLNLASRLAGIGVTVVWFSSDNVFDGMASSYADDARPSPLNEYGRQKAEVELALPGVCGGRFIMARLGKVYGDTHGDGTLLDEMLGRMAAGREVRAASDQVFCQVHVEDVVESIIALMDRGARGVYNLCAPGARSRLLIARTAARALGVPESIVVPIRLEDLGESFARPKRVVLDPGKLIGELGCSFRTIEEAARTLAKPYAREAGRD